MLFSKKDVRPRTFTKGRQLEVQNKLLLDDLFDYPLYELTIIFFSVSIFHHGQIIMKGCMPPQF